MPMSVSMPVWVRAVITHYLTLSHRMIFLMNISENPDYKSTDHAHSNFITNTAVVRSPKE